MKSHTRVVTISAVLATSILTHSAMAAERPESAGRTEAIGLGSGVVVGAALGGPVGAFVGALVGGLIADDINNTEQLGTLSAQLDKRESQLVAMHQELERVKQQSEMQLVSMDTQIEKVFQEMESSIQFRTASYQLESHYQRQLDLIAEGLKANPELTLVISGYADQRGDSTYNQALSEQRALSVKNYLQQQGVEDTQLQSRAFGESQLLADEAAVATTVTASKGKEDFYFERRVVLKLSKGKPVMTAAN